MKNSDDPAIELYMYSLNQEFPVEKGHSVFLKNNTDRYVDTQGKIVDVKQIANQILKRIGASDWSVQWISNEWIQNYTYYPGGSLVEKGDPLIQIVEREEEFGAILFDRVNDRIYKVNKPGLMLFKKIVAAHKNGRINEFKTAEFKPEAVKTFISFLKGAAIWPNR
jgi:hypothetical protein